MKNRKRWVSIMAGFLALVMLLSLIISILPTKARALSSSEIQSEIDDLEDQADELEAQYYALQDQLDENFDEIVDVVRQKYSIEEQINLIVAQMNVLNNQIDAYNRLIADTQEKLDVETEKYQQLNEKYKERIRTMEEEGNLSYWSVLFKANSFSDLLDRVNMIQEIADADTRRIRELDESARAISEAKEILAEQKAQTEKSQNALADTQQLLDAKHREAQSLIEVLLEREAEFEAYQQEVAEEWDALIDEIGAKEAEYTEAVAREQAALQATIHESEDYVPSGGTDGWAFPLAYCIRVASAYGWRIHPITGEYSFHSGIDLSAYSGTEIYAARDGIVTTSQYNWSLGNYVVVNHGDGYSTLYAHMVERAAEVGDYVSQGEVIGYVGSTGESTGPHLHYVVYYRGSTVNPAAYL